VVFSMVVFVCWVVCNSIVCILFCFYLCFDLLLGVYVVDCLLFAGSFVCVGVLIVFSSCVVLRVFTWWFVLLGYLSVWFLYCLIFVVI